MSVEDLRSFRFNYKEPIAYNRKSNHVPKQLKKLKKINNQRLNGCANKDLADLDELLSEISRAKVFVLVKSENDIKAKKGIINRGDDKYYIDDDGFGHIFSSWDKIEKLDDNVYVTVPIPEIYVRYILNNDYEGIILNGDYILSREFLILNINTIISYSHQNDMGDYSNYGLKLYD